MGDMRIDVRDLHRRLLFRAEADLRNPPPVLKPPPAADRPLQHPDPPAGAAAPPAAAPGPGDVYLQWDRAVDDEGHLRRCPVCGCRELFARRDFPQVTGFAVVVGAALVSMVLFGFGQVLWAVGVLAAVVLIDFGIFLFTGRALVCYRCRSEFRKLPIPREHPGWDLAIGEKYRRLPTDPPPPATAASPGPTDSPRPTPER